MRILIITPHLSTGGLPQYLYWWIKNLNLPKEDVCVVEYDFLSSHYVVQRNKIQEISTLHTLKDNKIELLNVIRRFKADVIHIFEHPELFMNRSIAKNIYENDTPIIESTHTSRFNIQNKEFLPDKFILPCEFSRRLLLPLNVSSDVVEYEHTPISITKQEAQKQLGFDPNKKHVLNVGLFTPGKNQKEVFDLAREMEDKDVLFHFVGNQAQNFEEYWKPLMENKPSNCMVWGERDDVDVFYAASDLFYFTSKEELNPLCVKEALSYNLPVAAYNLPPYLNKYDELVTYIDNNGREIVNRLLNKEFRIKLVHLLSQPHSERERQSIRCLAPMAQFGIDYIQHVNVPLEVLPEQARQKDRPNLNAGHLGCYMAFQSAIHNEFQDYDFLMICECDCKLLVSHNDFYLAILKACDEIIKNKIDYFSFGDTKDLEAGVLQSEYFGGYDSDFAFETNKIIGIQSIIFPKSSKKFLLDKFHSEPWNGMDIWFNDVFKEDGRKIGIVKNRLTSQFNGISLIDNKEKSLL